METSVALKGGDDWTQCGLTAEDLKHYCVSEGHFFMCSGQLLLIDVRAAREARARCRVHTI